MVHGTLAQSGAQTINTFFNTHILFLMLEDKVEHAIETLDGEVILAWQTCESKLFFKVLLSFETKSSYFEIEVILFFKESFSFKTISSFEDNTSFFFKTSSNHFYFLKFYFPLGQGQVGI